MKIIKLRRNQQLYKRGFTHAFRFTHWHDDNYGQVILALRTIYNDRRWRGKYWAWEVESSSRVVENPYGRWESIIWVAVRSEAMVTRVLLSMQ